MKSFVWQYLKLVERKRGKSKGLVDNLNSLGMVSTTNSVNLYLAWRTNGNQSSSISISLSNVNCESKRKISLQKKQKKTLPFSPLKLENSWKFWITRCSWKRSQFTSLQQYYAKITRKCKIIYSSMDFDFYFLVWRNSKCSEINHLYFLIYSIEMLGYYLPKENIILSFCFSFSKFSTSCSISLCIIFFCWIYCFFYTCF